MTSRIAPADTNIAAHALIVDDDKYVLSILGIYLSNGGYRVTKVASGIEALAVSENERVDLFVLDISMPVMDGLTLCRAIRKSTQNSEAPVLFVSALADNESTRTEVYKSGGSAMVRKPVFKEELLAAARNLTQRNEHARLVRRLQGKMPLFSALADTLSHAISNPLLAIRLASFHLGQKAALGDVPAAKVQEFTSIIETSGEKIGLLLSDITAVARGQVKDQDGEDTQLSIEQLVTIAIKFSMIRFEGSRFTFSFPEKDPISARSLPLKGAYGGLVCSLLGMIDDAVSWLSALSDAPTSEADKKLALGIRSLQSGLAEVYIIAGSHDSNLSPTPAAQATQDKKPPSENRQAHAGAPSPALKKPDPRADWSDALLEARVFAEASGAILSSAVEGRVKATRIAFHVI